MCLTYFLSLYPFAVPKPDFLYKTASLQWGGGGCGGGVDIIFHVENKFWFRQILQIYQCSKLLYFATVNPNVSIKTLLKIESIYCLKTQNNHRSK